MALAKDAHWLVFIVEHQAVTVFVDVMSNTCLVPRNSDSGGNETEIRTIKLTFLYQNVKVTQLYNYYLSNTGIYLRYQHLSSRFYLSETILSKIWLLTGIIRYLSVHLHCNTVKLQDSERKRDNWY